MSEHDEPSKPALRRDNPDPDKGEEGDKGLGTETGAEGAAADPGRDVTEMMPEARGEVRYADEEDPDNQREPVVPKEGYVEDDPDRARDSSSGAKD